MREAYKEYAGDSGPNWILDLDGPDGNVYNLWGILEQFFDLYDWEGDPVEESKNGGHYVGGGAPYEGYEGVLDYCLHHLSPSPAGIVLPDKLNPITVLLPVDTVKPAVPASPPAAPVTSTPVT